MNQVEWRSNNVCCKLTGEVVMRGSRMFWLTKGKQHSPIFRPNSIIFTDGELLW